MTTTPPTPTPIPAPISPIPNPPTPLSASEAAIATAFAIRSYLTSVEEQTATALLTHKLSQDSVVMRTKYLACVAQGFSIHDALLLCMQKWPSDTV